MPWKKQRNNMCGRILWIIQKIWSIFQSLKSLSDKVTDVTLLIELILNCHLKYAIASSLILLMPPTFCWLRGYQGQRDCFWFVHQIKLNWKIFWHGQESVTENQVRFLGSINVITSMLESLPEIGLAFYIMNHHGLDDPVFSNTKGDLQYVSLTLSVLCIWDSVIRRHAWVKYKTGRGCPTTSDIVKAALWNTVPLLSFLVALFIIMAHYELLFIYLVLLGLQMGLFLVLNQWSDFKWLDGYSMNRFMFVNTLFIAVIFTIQLFAFQVEENPNLRMKSFNNCLGTVATGKLNYVFSNQVEFFAAIWFLVFVNLIHLFMEAIFPPKNGFVNFWNFMFQKLHLNLSNSDFKLQPV